PEARRGGDGAVVQLRAMAITEPVDRRQYFTGEARRLLQNVFHHVERKVRIGAVLDRPFEPADVAHHEQHLVDGGAIGHGKSSASQSVASARTCTATAGVCRFRPRCRCRRPHTPACAQTLKTIFSAMSSML